MNFFPLEGGERTEKKGNMMKSNTVELYLAKKPPLDLAVLEIIFLFSFL